ncbi:ThiF family adenylyltransferase [Patescibacteria group bacterium]|nr:ThiF family adenylyltransferase [Patescibacteria group bacterium]
MDFRRQLDILDPNVILYPVVLIGCGGIGSPTALTLAKMGCPDLTFVDPDIVEEHNLPNQLFRLKDVDRPKAESCKDAVSEFSNCSARAVSEKFDGSQELSGIVISGVDSMASRQLVWDKVRWNLNVPLYIDGRIGGEVIQVYAIRPNQIEDIEFYENNLFPDDEVEVLPCTERAIMYVGFTIAGLIGAQFKKWLKEEQLFRKITFYLKTMRIVPQ